MTPETREYDEYFFPQTLEEIIDRLQEYAKCGLSINGRDASHARKWADKLRAELSRLRTIPADRVLGEGCVSVDREELCLLRQLESGWREPHDLSAGERARIITRLDALRAKTTTEKGKT